MGSCSIATALHAAKHTYPQAVLSVLQFSALCTPSYPPLVRVYNMALQKVTGILCAGDEAQSALEYLKKHEAETEKLLQELVAIPSISALPGM